MQSSSRTLFQSLLNEKDSDQPLVPDWGSAKASSEMMVERSESNEFSESFIQRPIPNNNSDNNYQTTSLVDVYDETGSRIVNKESRMAINNNNQGLSKNVEFESDMDEEGLDEGAQSLLLLGTSVQYKIRYSLDEYNDSSEGLSVIFYGTRDQRNNACELIKQYVRRHLPKQCEDTSKEFSAAFVLNGSMKRDYYFIVCNEKALTTVNYANKEGRYPEFTRDRRVSLPMEKKQILELNNDNNISNPYSLVSLIYKMQESIRTHQSILNTTLNFFRQAPNIESAGPSRCELRH